MKSVAAVALPPDSANAANAPQTPAADAGPKPRPHGPARGIAGVGLTPEQVNQAIDKGMKALWAYCSKKDADEGVSFGEPEEDVLCALALVHADAHRKIPAFDAALRSYLTHVDPAHLPGSHQTYVNGLLCMLIQAYGDPAFDSKLQTATRWLLESQGPDGTWTYAADLPDKLFAAQAPAVGALQISGGLPPGAASKAWTRQLPWPKDDLNGDNSCTQYAMLGLQSATSSGIRLPAELWQRALATARKRQGVNSGGWDYQQSGEGDNDGYGSMTGAGVCAVAMSRYRLGDTNFANDPAIVHGLGWMDTHFSVQSHPGYNDEKSFAFYWLYSIERVGRMLDTDFIGIHEWYPEGAAWLVGNQGADGLWNGLAGDEATDTRLPSSFALLFLTRATPSLKPIERHGPGMLKTAAVAPNNRFYIILDCSGSMIDNMDGKLKFDIARGSVQSLVDALPPNSEVALRVYGHRKSALDPDCDLDTELKIPMGPLDKEKFTEALNSLRARGKTPLALSINEAIKDLGEIDEKSPVTLLLLTDGGEDTFKPRGNPVQACADMAKVKNLTFHIV
ncbi:MAG TPA: vWA domain-containing protein, partial [Tepidisphaeraceae bacterium]|nr:vWA domain-containing protein [Tepidisphaeraceae bacterium]